MAVCRSVTFVFEPIAGLFIFFQVNIDNGICLEELTNSNFFILLLTYIKGT